MVVMVMVMMVMMLVVMIVMMLVVIIGFTFYLSTKYRAQRHVIYVVVAVMLGAIALMCLIAHGASSCYIEVRNGTLVIRHMGCVLTSCTTAVNLSDIVEVYVTEHRSPCELLYRSMGLGSIVMSSGWYETTCGKTLVHIVSKDVIVTMKTMIMIKEVMTMIGAKMTITMITTMITKK